MNNERNALLCFDNSTNLLKAVFPEENWTWFLTKNMHGLTDGFPTIQFDNNTSDVVYWLEDLEKFAVAYAQDSLSTEDIASMIDDHMARLNLQSMLAALSSDGDSFSIQSAFMSQETIHKDGSVDFNLKNPGAWSIAIGEMSEEQLDTGYALTTLAHAIRMVGAGMELSASEAAALSGIAITHANRACDNADRIRSILS